MKPTKPFRRVSSRSEYENKLAPNTWERPSPQRKRQIRQVLCTSSIIVLQKKRKKIQWINKKDCQKMVFTLDFKKQKPINDPSVPDSMLSPLTHLRPSSSRLSLSPTVPPVPPSLVLMLNLSTFKTSPPQVVLDTALVLRHLFECILLL